ncbi:polysaccharide pyruvyl transferase family protein [Leucobacter celer]|uniref:polysaccharide pyruvyl transferase family protein n=1 Tax=Leucobacter celer TaxID=668625 RepID=UPI0006A777C3|nr:polysaccharide pyruvyl transferase family protein [Leucobacter celer]
MGSDAPRAARVLVLWADESSPNLGVAALARGSRDLLRRAAPDAEFTFANYGSRPAQVPWGRTRSLVKERVLSRLGMQDYFAGFDLIWDTRSGDSFADIYGLPRHLTMSAVHEFACQSGTPVMLAPQTIGPFGTKRGRALARRVLRRSAAVFARDPQSDSAAAALGRRPDAVTADLVFGIDPPAAGTRRDILLNVSGLLWTPNAHVDAHAYRTIVRDIVERLQAEGREVSLLAHVRHSDNADDDVPAIDDLRAGLRGDIEVVVPDDLDSVRADIAGANAVIGSRMHACLNALSVGVPAIPLAYSRKFGSLLESVGWRTGFDLRTDDATALAARVVTAVGDVSRDDARAVATTGRASLEQLLDPVRAAL